jgi:hypothetical protein
VAQHRSSYVPRHRDPEAAAGARVRRASGAVIRHAVMLSTLSAAATGTVVTGGVLLGESAAADSPDVSATAVLPSPTAVFRTVAQEASEAARSDRRDATDPRKAAALASPAGVGVTRREDLSEGDPREIARVLLPEYGFSEDQFGCLDNLYVSESGWQVDADNPTSTAYGIPQALTGLHDLPPGYMTSAEVQIKWGLDYIRTSYGNPCGAWAFKRENNWY